MIQYEDPGYVTLDLNFNIVSLKWLQDNSWFEMYENEIAT